MRRIILAAAVVAAACSVARGATASQSSVGSLMLTGRGLGHGIGLSQWGAEARARAGESADDILAFYYPGTTVAGTPVSAIRVLIGEALPRVRVGGRDFVAGRVRRAVEVGAADSATRVGATRYPGVIRVVPVAGKLDVVDVVPLEEYVADVVSSECPGYWSEAALEAQAVASRSYAVASLRPRRFFDVYADDRSQNFNGLRKHLPRAVAATRATAGHVLEYRGRVVTALFSASNGGRTSVPDGVWAADDEPYFRAVPDPFDESSPVAHWGPVRISLDAVRRAFPRVPADVVGVTVTRNAGDRVVRLRFAAASGATVVVSGYAFQQRFGLRSTFFTLDAS
ncbi:MAG TPA: SpoIID/LytB domain-containing protein [Gaiellaceae bacterium]|nr:SpoIID/LytB domain-containing protein [Gaiellaceae bacterium]